MKTLWILIITMLGLSLGNARAQTPGFIPVTNAAGYSQNFDIMGPDGTNAPPGWYGGGGTITITVNSTNVTVSDGSLFDNDNYNFGTTANSDRALGSLRSGTGSQIIEARFENLSSSLIPSFIVNYVGEQWRQAGTSGTNDTLTMQYSANGTNFANMAASFTFNTPQDTGTVGALDGNLAANRVTGIGGTYTPSVVISNGQRFFLRWSNGGGISVVGHGMGIDDLSITLNLSNPPPVVVTLPATNVINDAATLNGTVNPNGLSTLGWFDWGTTTNYGNQTTSTNVGSGWVDVSMSMTLTGLFGQTYYYRAVASNSLGLTMGTNQSFATPVFILAVTNLTGVQFGSSAWGDYDNDGRLDILLTGGTATNNVAQVWRINGGGFTNINAGLPGVSDSSAAWGDYDNDGWLDILLTGTTNGSARITQIWRNTGSGFTNINAGLPGVMSGSAAWGDYDNDGRLDILLAGGLAADNITKIWRNTGGGFVNIDASLPGIISGSVAWGDYDNDGRLDILLAGSATTKFVTEVWRNTGSGFTNINAGMQGVYNGSAEWGDYDNDGRLDILLTGSVDSNYLSQVWRNTGSGFTNINAGLLGVGTGFAAWGDYDNDGWRDIVLSGVDTNGAQRSQVWRNTGSGFTNINEGLTGVGYAAGVWGDYDNDGRLDILLTGNTGGVNGISQIWRNNTPLTNAPPGAPSDLNLTVSNLVATLTWNASADNVTPAAGLTYNVRVGTTPGASDAFAPMADTGGLRRLPQLGNVQHGLTATFNYALNTPYYWSVQAVDSAFAGSPFAPEDSFRFVVAPIPATATNIVAGDIDGDGLVGESEFDAVLTNITGVISEDDLLTILAHYWPYSPFLEITNVAGLGGSNVFFALPDPTLGAFGVESSSNLVDWLFRGPASPRYSFIETNSPPSTQLYYRLRWP